MSTPDTLHYIMRPEYSDLTEAEELAGAIEELLNRAYEAANLPRDQGEQGGILLDLVNVAIPSGALHEALAEFWGERRLTHKMMTSRLNSLAGIGPLRALSKNPSRRQGRSWIWFGTLAKPGESPLYLSFPTVTGHETYGTHGTSD